MKDKTGKLIVISAPSGTGKTTVVKRLLDKIPNIIASVSFTTRPMRENEREGIDYFFVDKKIFFKAEIGETNGQVAVSLKNRL